MVVSHSAEIYGAISADGGSGSDHYTSDGTSVWDHGGSGGGSESMESAEEHVLYVARAK